MSTASGQIAGAPSRLTLPPDLSRLAEVRAWAWEAGTSASLPESRIFDLQVTVSEATANAIEHAASEVELSAWLLPDRLIVDINNDGVFQPGLVKADGRRRGLGLPLMVSLADQVHVSRLEGNRTKVSLTFFAAAREPSENGSESAPDVRRGNPARAGVFGSAGSGRSLLLLLLLLLPLPLLMILAVVFHVGGIDGAHESAGLLTAFNTLFTSAAGLLVAYLAARTYRVGGSSVQLALGSGAIVLALSSLLAGPMISDPNGAITVYNTAVLVSGALFLVSGFLALRPRTTMQQQPARWKLASAYGVSVAFVAVWATLASTRILHGVLPTFYVAGAGFTDVRRAVLALAVLFLVAASVCYALIYHKRSSRFALLASASFATFAVALGILVLTEPLTGTPINWLVRVGTWLGGAYLLMGAISVDYGRGWLLQIERDLEETRIRYQGLVEVNPDAVWIRSEGRFVFANAAAARLLGYPSVSELIGKDVDEAFHPETREVQRERVAEVYAGGISPATDEMFLRADGSTVYVSIFRTRVEYKGRLGIQAVARDITERKLAEEALREREEQLSFLLELSDALRPLEDPAEILRVGGRVLAERLGADRVVYANLAMDDADPYLVIEHGYHVPGLPDAHVRDPLDSLSRLERGEYLQGKTVSASDTEQDSRFSKEEAERYAGLKARAFIGVPIVKHGRLVSVLGVLDSQPRTWTPSDVFLAEQTAQRTWEAVERARIEAELRESETNFRSLFEGSPDAIFMAIAGGPIIAANPAACAMFEMTEEELCAAGRAGIEAPDSVPSPAAFDERARTGKVRYEAAHVRKSGVRFPSEVTSVLVEGGTRSIVIIRDITGRKQAEEELRESEEQSAFLLELTDALRPIADPIAVQETASRLLGEYLKADRLTYFEVRGDDYIVERDYAPSLPHLSGPYPIAAFGERLLAAYRAGRMVVSNDIADDPIPPQERDSFFSIQVHAQISVPLIKNGEFVAGLSVHSATPRTWKPQEMRLIEDAAERTWAAVERGRAEAALHESEERMQHIAQVGRIGFVEWNAAKDAGYWSREHQEIFGYEPGSPMSWEQWLQGVHPEDRERVVANASRLLDRGRCEGQVRGHWDVYRFIRPNGNTVWIESDMSVDMVRDEPIIRGSVRDITERKQAEAALRESEKRLRLAQQAGRVGTFDWDLQLDRDVWTPELEALYGLQPGEFAQTGTAWAELIHPDDRAHATQLAQQSIKSGELTTGEWRVVWPDGSVHWLAGRWQVFRDASGQPQHMTGVNMDITERKRAEKTLLRLNRTLAAHSASDQALIRATEESSYLAEVCRIVVQDCGHAMVWIGYKEDNDDKSIRPVASAGFEEGYLETLNITWADGERGRGPTGTAVRTGRPAKCRNMLTDPAFAPWREEAVRRGYASSVSLPLLQNGIAFGAIMIYSSEPDPFSDDEVKLLADLTDDLALGITTLRLRTAHAEAEREREILLAEEQQLAEELQAKNEELQTQTEELAARERQLREQNRELRVSRYNRTLIEASLDPLVTIGLDGTITDVNEATVKITGYTRKELIGTDFSDYFTAPESARSGYREVFANGSATDYPLTVRARDGKLTDVLYNATVYKDEEGAVLGVFAAARDMTAIKELEEQREIASVLQKALLDLPQRAPGVEFGHLYRSATHQAQVGGDFYDVFEAKGGRIAILIGDVSGHGLEAARIATFAKDVIAAFAHQFRWPHLVLRETSRLLVEKNLPGFVTAFLGFLDPESGALVYSSAGHPPPLLSAEGQVESLSLAGTPLGVFADARYRDIETEIQKGSVLLFYTDGITEARRDGDLFGEQRLGEALGRMRDEPIDELPQLLLGEALDFSDGILRDDVALLAINYLGGAGGKGQSEPK